MPNAVPFIFFLCVKTGSQIKNQNIFVNRNSMFYISIFSLLPLVISQSGLTF